MAVVVALGLIRFVRRLARQSRVGDELNRRCRRPAVLVASVLGIAGAIDSSPLAVGDRNAISHVVSLLLIASMAWLVVETAFVGEDFAMQRFDVADADNLRARKVRTQIVVLRRVTVIVIGVLAAAAMLTTFHQARALGTSLLASAGIVGLAAGAAARPTLGNLVAGVQIAFSEPIRLDDVVVVEGEWGRIEEITLTYVVVRIWDSRRLVLPVSYFVERPFQNWTRSTADLLSTAYFHVDYRTPIGDMRAAFERIVAESPHWDGRSVALQVTDTSERTLEVRALMSAADSPSAFELRCEVRERLVAWLHANHPDSLPRARIEHVDDRELQDTRV